MSLNAVQIYVAQQLDGLDAPGSVPAAQAWVLPPTLTQPGENPQIYVWGSVLTEERATLPRATVAGNGGQKRISHTLTLYIQWITEQDPSNAQDFPLLLDAIRGVLRGLNLKTPVVDPTTGETTYITDLGETIQLSYATPTAVAGQRLLQFNATFRLPFHEWLGGS